MLCLSRKSSFISQNELCMSFTSTFILHCLPLFHPQANAIEKRNNKFNCCMASSSKKRSYGKNKRKTVEYMCLLPNTQYIHLILLSLIFFLSYAHNVLHSTGIIINADAHFFYKVKNSLTYDYSESQIIFFNIQKT